jgi:hypothetical protein
MSFTLRHLESGASLTDSQRAAVVAFLETVRELGREYLADQATQALSYWA